jgi:hypothetical protein
MPLSASHEGSANSEKITPQADMGNIYFQKIQISGPAMNFVLEKWREYQPPFPQKLRQLGDVHRDPPRLVFGEQLCRRFAWPGSSSK